MTLLLEVLILVLHRRINYAKIFQKFIFQPKVLYIRMLGIMHRFSSKFCFSSASVVWNEVECFIWTFIKNRLSIHGIAISDTFLFNIFRNQGITLKYSTERQSHLLDSLETPLQFAESASLPRKFMIHHWHFIAYEWVILPPVGFLFHYFYV